MSENYIPKAITTTITANSKCTVKIRDNYYSIEFTEERSIPQTDDVDIELERRALFEDVNSIVDDQMEDIVNSFSRKR